MAETFYANINKKSVQVHPLAYAKKLFKENINVGEAIVSVLGNTGIAGFKFNCPQTEQVNMESDITDYYTDANSVMQDHIARRPITITVSGLQGEYFYSVNPIEDMLAKVVPILNLVKQFLPRLTPATKQIKTLKNSYNEEMLALASNYATYDKDAPISFNDKFQTAWNVLNGVDLFQLFQDLYKLKSAQTRAFMFFEALWRAGAPFSVETTWKRYDNMLIQKVTPVRDNNADITEFSVTFKQINIAQSLYTDLDNAAGRTREQLSKLTEKGTAKGEEVKVI